MPNHGSSKGFRVHRMTANRWELVRTPQGWKIKRRTLRQLDGSASQQAPLAPWERYVNELAARGKL